MSASFGLWLIVASWASAQVTTPDSTELVLETPDIESEIESEESSLSAPPPPIGVRFGEPLEGGERVRVAYSFERSHRKGLLVGDRTRTAQHIIDNSYQPYESTPRSLDVTSHTFQLFYAPHPRATLVVEVPFYIKKLQTRSEFAVRSQDESTGVGDVEFALVVPFIRKGGESSHVHVGFDIPTGSIRRGGDDTRLPFDLQPGNGTFDFEWGWTYRGEMDWLSWGGQALGWHPIGRNGLSYRDGSRFEASIWSGVRIFRQLSASFRMSWEKQNNIRKHDAPQSITDPSFNSKARGGTYLTVSPGISIGLPPLGSQRLSVETDIPIYQDLSGPQLKRRWSVKAGWQWAY